MAQNIFALLVGINNYPTPVPQLEGCVNDVNAVEEYLQNRLDPDKYLFQAKKLVDQGATRKAVIEGFQEHLCRAGENDIALFFFSGHGSQEQAPPEFWDLEPNKTNETLVCWDSRTSDWDLADKELGYLISQVAKKNPHFLVILDCCHSGSGTRDTEPKKGVRHNPADRRARSIQNKDYIFSLAELENVFRQTQSGEVLEKSSGWRLPKGRHVVFSACQDRELASEYTGDGQQWGAFSYFLLETLTKASGPLTYRELFKRTDALVRLQIKDQTPQLEAIYSEDLDAFFLSKPNEASALKSRDPYFTLSFNGSDWEIDRGAVHGLPQLSSEPILLALYPLEATAEDVKQVSQAVGEAEVINVLPGKSIVKFTEGKEPKELTIKTVLKAVITRLPLPPLGIYFEGDEIALDLARQELQKAGLEGKPSMYIREVANLNEAQYRLLARNNEYLVTKPTDDRPLVEEVQGYNQPKAWKVIQNLEHIARWTTIAKLSNVGANELPTNAVEMHLYRDWEGQDKITATQLRMEYEGDKGPSFYLKLKNTTDQELYCALFDLTEEYSVTAPLFPNTNGGIRLAGGQEQWAYERKPIPLNVPDSWWKRGITEYQDVLKLIASTVDFDPSLLIQGKLGSPRSNQSGERRADRDLSVTSRRKSTLNRLMNQATNRGIAEVEPEEVDQWVASQITITTVRPKDSKSIHQDADLGFGVRIEQNPGLVANARLSTVPQATRDLGSRLLPPLLRDYTRPFQFTASRGVDPGLSVLELQVGDERSSNINFVTPQTPLVLAVDKPLGEDEFILPVAYDGEFFIPLGQGATKDGKTQIQIERLPDPVVEQQKRSLGGSIRIFFQKVVYKQLGAEFPYPKLRVAHVAEDDTVTYEEDPQKVKEAVAKANKIVLYIHGIIGDTESMVPSIRRAEVSDNGQNKPLSEIYDLVLTFDYENLNTTIKEVGKQLKDKLEAVGLSANHGKTLHIVAHSMGGLVSRSFIEQWGGNEVVQHLVMLGTPNAGSPWSTLEDWLLFALTFGLNNLSAVPIPIQFVSSALKHLNVVGKLAEQIEKIDINLDDMHPAKSTFLPELNGCADPSLPYSIIAGNTSLIQQEQANRIKAALQRTIRRAIELPFVGQDNDIAVLVTSIRSVPTGRSPIPYEQVIACDHLSYFRHPEGLKALGNAVAQAFGYVVQPIVPPALPPQPQSKEVAAEESTTAPKEDLSPVSLEPVGNAQSALASTATERKPVQSEPSIEPSTQPKSSSNRVLIGAIAILSIAVVVLGFMLWRSSQNERQQENTGQILPHVSEPSS